MIKRNLAKKITAYFLLSCMSFEPYIFAEPVPDEHAPVEERPFVLEAKNHVPIVDITGSSEAGVSLNKYEDFNVDERGLILNNSFAMSDTKLAGWIDGNPNLQYGSADIIINQVTGDRASNLNGFVEVAG